MQISVKLLVIATIQNLLGFSITDKSHLIQNLMTHMAPCNVKSTTFRCKTIFDNTFSKRDAFTAATDSNNTMQWASDRKNVIG